MITMLSRPRRLTSLVVAVTAITAGVARSQNLIVNGGFESGRTGFTTDYTYDTGGAIPGELFMEGTYNVVDDASRYHDGDPSIGFVGLPHTGSLFYAANGDIVANATAWRSQLLTVGAGQTPYRFEVWMTSLRPITHFPGVYTDAPALNLEIGDGQNWTTLGTTGTFANGTQAGLWFFRYADAQFVQPGNYYVRLSNASLAQTGNDFGVDDLFFGVRQSAPSVGATPGVASPPLYNPASVVPEPSSLAMSAAAAALGIGALVRRRRT
jgi:hypothetical protein